MPTYTDRNGGEASRVDAPADVEEMARIRLQHSPYRAIRRVSCEFSQGILILHGKVATFHYKQLAQTAVADISGVTKILNEIEVDSAPYPDDSSG